MYILQVLTAYEAGAEIVKVSKFVVSFREVMDNQLSFPTTMSYLFL